MGLKSRSKVNAEFNMSSLTDIIFLLLIFFMLTSSLVQIRVDLPESDARTVAPTTATVTIMDDGTYKLNGKEIALSQIKGNIREILNSKDKDEKASITIAAERNLPWDQVTDVMRIANDLKVRAIMATKPSK